MSPTIVASLPASPTKSAAAVCRSTGRSRGSQPRSANSRRLRRCRDESPRLCRSSELSAHREGSGFLLRVFPIRWDHLIEEEVLQLIDSRALSCRSDVFHSNGKGSKRPVGMLLGPISNQALIAPDTQPRDAACDTRKTARDPSRS